MDSVLSLFSGELSLSEIQEMEVSQLNSLVKARLKAIETKRKADIAARQLEKEFKKM